jgi:hypothetical protein
MCFLDLESCGCDSRCTPLTIRRDLCRHPLDIGSHGPTCRLLAKHAGQSSRRRPPPPPFSRGGRAVSDVVLGIPFLSPRQQRPFPAASCLHARPFLTSTEPLSRNYQRHAMMQMHRLAPMMLFASVLLLCCTPHRPRPPTFVVRRKVDIRHQTSASIRMITYQLPLPATSIGAKGLRYRTKRHALRNASSYHLVSLLELLIPEYL